MSEDKLYNHHVGKGTAVVTYTMASVHTVNTSSVRISHVSKGKTARLSGYKAWVFPLCL